MQIVSAISSAQMSAVCYLRGFGGLCITHIIKYLSVAQWIEQYAPTVCAQVRFLSDRPNKKDPQGVFLFGLLIVARSLQQLQRKSDKMQNCQLFTKNL